MKRLLLSGVAVIALPMAAYANCPAISVADMQGVAAGAYPQQYDLSEFQAAAGCTMEFSANPDIATLNGQIAGNGELPSLADRLPEDPLVVVPYDSIGQYGGTLDVLSNATEAGTSDFLSVRHVNLVRYSDDLQTIVPNIAKSWTWNDDYTQLTFKLRKGHKWSDGAPFTSADVKFWHDNLMLDTNIYETPKDYVTVGGATMTVDAPDEETVVFNLPAPKPGLLAHFATSYAQGFQPMHFLGQFHPGLSDDADSVAQGLGFENGYDAIKAYYGNSDWTDTPTPMLSKPELVDGLTKHTVPTLESHIYINDTTEGRQLVANPYFHQVDPTGQQLPYISEQDEVYINDKEVRILKLVNGEVDYKSQSVRLESAPILLENQEAGGYTIQLKPTVAMPAFSFNLTAEDEAKRAVFADYRFREAMSVAINREELNEVAYFGQGTPSQIAPFLPTPDFIDPKWSSYKAAYDPDGAKATLDEIGMKDTDGDGFRELPNGDKLVLTMNYSTQGISGQVVELVSQYWADVGVESTVKEVTPDEYRSAQSSNKLDVGLWQYGAPLAIHLGLNTFFRAPFGTYFEHRTGMLWGEWLDSDGAKGVEPPEFVKKLAADIDAFQSASPGSPEVAELGNALVQGIVENLVLIGTVAAPEPVYSSNKLQNFTEFKTWSYEYYRTYPYRGSQWWLTE
ncbi:ABC transporter substrate-binding protein [Roseovarius aestuarii]|uniref:Putative ABC transporter-binding protein n=1 Tax=Roseovarius aestuarii TaxID=475083 RepID=A0A1X7BKT7_9RHOB|nr:ABC transporter substrate-binding protein [Roseovarius aestuarii]SMC10263.1 putative ABC transporter-binding protein precursor [Roseovarius aestuarii]